MSYVDADELQEFKTVCRRNAELAFTYYGILLEQGFSGDQAIQVVVAWHRTCIVPPAPAIFGDISKTMDRLSRGLNPDSAE